MMIVATGLEVGAHRGGGRGSWRPVCQRLAGVWGRVAPDAEGLASAESAGALAPLLIEQSQSPEPLPTIGGGKGASSPLIAMCAR